MKRLMSLLIVLALILSCLPAGIANAQYMGEYTNIATSSTTYDYTVRAPAGTCGYITEIALQLRFNISSYYGGGDVTFTGLGLSRTMTLPWSGAVTYSGTGYSTPLTASGITRADGFFTDTGYLGDELWNCRYMLENVALVINNYPMAYYTITKSGSRCTGQYGTTSAVAYNNLTGKYKRYTLALSEISYTVENGHVKINCHMDNPPLPVYYRVHNVTTSITSPWFTESAPGLNDAGWVDEATSGGNQYTYNIDFTFCTTYSYDNVNVGSVTVDTQAPAGTVSVPEYSTSTSVTVTNNFSDNVGITDIRYSEDGTNWGSWQTYASTMPYTFSGEGSHTIYAQCRDAMSNLSATGIYDTVIVDTTKPTGSVTSSSGSSYVGSTVNLTTAASDTNGVSNMILSINSDFSGSAWVAYNGSASVSIPGADGPYTIYCKYRDTAGNESNVYTLNVTKDTIGPTDCTITLQGLEGIPGETSSQSIAVIAGGTDTNGLSGITVSNDNSSWSPLCTTVVDGSYQYANFLLTEGRGTKTVYVRVYDLAGNYSLVSDTIMYNEDTTLPSVSMTLASPTGSSVYTLDPNITIRVTANDNATYKTNLQVRFSNDGLLWSAYAPYASSVSWNLVTDAGGNAAEGEKTVYINCKDEAGNVAYATATITYSSTQPAVSNGPIGDIVTACSDTDMNVAVTEINGEEVILCNQSIAYTPLPLDNTTTQYRVAIMGSDFGEWTTYTVGAAQKVPLTLGEGYVEVKVQGKNANGAISDEFILKFLIDYTKPVISSIEGLNGATCTKTNQFSIVATVDDNLSPEIWARYQINSGSWSALSLFGNSGDANTLVVTGCASGLNAIVIEFQDLNANITTRAINVFGI